MARPFASWRLCLLPARLYQLLSRRRDAQSSHISERFDTPECLILSLQLYTSGAFTHRTWNLIRPDSLTTSCRSLLLCGPTALNFSLQEHAALVTPASSHETGVTVSRNPTTAAISKLPEGCPLVFCSGACAPLRRSSRMLSIARTYSQLSDMQQASPHGAPPLSQGSLDTSYEPRAMNFSSSQCASPPSIRPLLGCLEIRNVLSSVLPLLLRRKAKWSYSCVRHRVHRQQVRRHGSMRIVVSTWRTPPVAVGSGPTMASN